MVNRIASKKQGDKCSAVLFTTTRELPQMMATLSSANLAQRTVLISPFKTPAVLTRRMCLNEKAKQICRIK